MKIPKIGKRRFLYLAILSFIFIATSTISLSASNNLFGENILDSISELVGIRKVFSPLPVLAEGATFPILSAQAVLAIDEDSQVPLFEKNAQSPVLPASTTKIVTALVALDTYPLDQVLTVGNIKVEGQKMRLIKGEKITVENLLYGLLVYSANDAAEVLADSFPGGRDAFIDAMNKKAKELHLENTSFYNPTGLDGNGHVTTAKDLIRVSEVAMRNFIFAQIVATKEKVVKSEDGKITHNLVNINELLGKVPGVMGIKTGWTENARENLVTYLERDNHKIYIAVLGSQDRFGETKELIDWIFTHYTWQEVSPLKK
jgi:D-alanyl-D-alanine carboxypeptidase (penicillin-binding protein 5/6)